MFCKYCGNEIDKDAYVCIKCGKIVAEPELVEVQRSEINKINAEQTRHEQSALADINRKMSKFYHTMILMLSLAVVFAVIVLPVGNIVSDAYIHSASYYSIISMYYSSASLIVGLIGMSIICAVLLAQFIIGLVSFSASINKYAHPELKMKRNVVFSVGVVMLIGMVMPFCAILLS